MSGYQLVARSPGVGDDEARQLTVWGPSHDALQLDGPAASAISFWRLQSGRYCVARTNLAGGEFSQRGGQQVVTHYLLVEPLHFERFGCQPLAVFAAACASGALEPAPIGVTDLPPLRLLGRAAPFDADVVAQVTALWGAAWLAATVQTVLETGSLGIMSDIDPRTLMGAFINCLPVACRGNLSFTTGLKYSPRRPFRVTCMATDVSEARRLSRGHDLAVLIVDRAASPAAAMRRGWAQWVYQTCAERNWDRLRLACTQAPATVGWEQLDAWGQQLVRGEFGVAAAHSEPGSCAEPVPGRGETLSAGRPKRACSTRRSGSVPGAAGLTSESANRTALRACQVLAELSTDPSDVLTAERPAAAAQLALLDDTVFEAIAGKSAALDRLRSLWPQVQADLGPELVEESRMQYMRHALAVWRDCVAGEEIQQPERAIRALEVLCLVFAEA